ncbi:hypothetical protein [Bacillus sp. FJAT-22090]|uniref:hypothetical protein n=1 Tax=Bacillus sp. FJAT-22090 TaxID=1581038 RepID=UPI0011A0E32C|nr:hypothetical protein [Bacillus sp. FJAT-22090]
MKRNNVFIIVLMLLSMTTLLTYDFFPDLIGFIYLPKSLVLALLIVIVIFSILSNRFQKDNQRITLLWQMVSTLYLFLLVVASTVLGGNSQIGISLKNPVLWIVIVISIYEIYEQNKKVKVLNSFSE